MMKTGRVKIRRILPLLMIMLIFSGCIGQIPEEEKDRWYSVADPIAENILQSINNDDYQGFTRDFSQEQIAAIPPEGFTDLRELLLSKIGKYISKASDTVMEDEEYMTVIYSAKFEEEDNVTVRVVFKKGDETYHVYGLWFDSPKLRK
jgi:hypothetical protein